MVDPSQKSSLSADAGEFQFNIGASDFVPSFTVEPEPPKKVYTSENEVYYYPSHGMVYDQDTEEWYDAQEFFKWGHNPYKTFFESEPHGGWIDFMTYREYCYNSSYPNHPHYPSRRDREEEEEEKEEDDGYIDYSTFLNMSSAQQAKLSTGNAPASRGPPPKPTEKLKPVAKKPKVEAKPKPPKTVVHKKVDKDKLISKSISAAGAPSTSVEPDPTRDPVNIVFIGHVDAGKSTICGNILLLTGKVDPRLVEQYTEEAKTKGRDSWWLAYIMDESEEERAKGKTIEVGRAYFSTPHKRYTILDAPGHKSYVPNMIGGASQADFAALVISARIGEFETGFDRGGQTREHVLLARSLGVETLIIVVNKMDDDSVGWSEERYSQIKNDLSPFLVEACKYNLQTDIHWVPISGLKGGNILERESDPRSGWYSGPTLLEILDTIPTPPRSNTAPLRIPIIDKTKDQGLIAYGKVESGKCVKGLKVMIMPINIQAEVNEIYGSEEEEFVFVNSGENIKLKLKVPDEIEVQRGYVLCDIHDFCHVNSEFKAYVDFLELLENKPIITRGYECILHIHTAIEECQITEIIAVIDTERKKKISTQFGKSNQKILLKIRTVNPICVENYNEVAALGRFTLRDEGKTIGIGKVVEQITKKAEGVADDLGI